VKKVFVDTSGFYAFLDGTDPFHDTSKNLFLKGAEEGWHFFTSSFVVHESWALIQARLGWDAVEDFLSSLMPCCEIVWVGESIHALGAARARQARERRLSLTDCISFEVMLSEHCTEAIADDEYFRKAGFSLAS
jgi:predicted nucleic acid-binding protein